MWLRSLDCLDEYLLRHTPLPNFVNKGDSNMESKIDSIVEAERDRDIDLLSDAAPLPFQLVEEKQDIYDLAVILAGLRQLDLPHVIDWSRGSFGKATIHVHPDWFNKEFAGNPNVVVEPIPEHSAVKKSIMYEGVDIFCWMKAKFVMEGA